MGKFDGILICTDLDGTLYRDDKTISKENKEAVEYFKREGGYFTFVTGRMPYYSRDAYDKVRPNAPFGCINGGGGYDGADMKYIWTTELPREALGFVKYIDELFPSVGIQLCGFDKTYFAKENDTTVKFRATTGIPNYTCDYRNFDVPMGKIMFCTDIEEEILAIDKALHAHEMAGDFDFIRTARSLYEILPRGTHKGLAIDHLASYLGIDRARTIAVGDYDNDAAMLRAAGCGIAVANSSRAALDAADRVTVSNEEHAIARVICDIERGNIKYKR